MRRLFFIYLFIQTTLSFAQEKWISGDVIKNGGDTIQCLIRVRNKPLSSSVYVKVGKERAIYISDSIEGYSYGEKVFESISFGNEIQLMEKLQEGKITLYKLDGNFYIQKNLQEPDKLGYHSFDNTLKKYLIDCPSCVERLNNRGTQYSDVENIIFDYNNQTDYTEITDSTDSIYTYYKQKNVLFKLNFLSPGIATEIKTVENLTLYFEAGSSFYITSKGKMTFIPIVKFQTRYYYNLNRRKEKGKNVRSYSGNYFGIDLRHYFSTEETSNTTYIAPVYGLQRSYSHRFFYNLDVGIGYSPTVSEFSPIFTARWGMWF